MLHLRMTEETVSAKARLLASTPGVGPIVSLTYAAAVDDPARFRSSKRAGAHFGLTLREGLALDDLQARLSDQEKAAKAAGIDTSKLADEEKRLATEVDNGNWKPAISIELFEDIHPSLYARMVAVRSEKNKVKSLGQHRCAGTAIEAGHFIVIEFRKDIKKFRCLV